MNELDKAVSYLEKSLEKFNLEWINTGRVSDDWKSKIFGHTVSKRQLGIYHRKTMILIRLENYEGKLPGVTVQPKIPKGDSWEASFSRFRRGKGVCVKVDTLESFKTLVEEYYFTERNNEHD